MNAVEHKKVGNLLVTRTTISGTSIRVYDAWVVARIDEHPSAMTLEGVPYRRFAAGKVPPEIEALAVGPERWEAIDEWRAMINRFAYQAISKAFPNAESGDRGVGTITTHEAA